MNWFQKNFKTLIYVSFLVPILTVAFVSISHVTKWYGISNPVSWAIYLSIGIEIAALSALAAISAQMGRKVYFPFGVVTLIQFIGNIFFAYQYIDINSELFKSWVDMVDPLVSYMGVESGNVVGHKRFLALFSGGMLPLISLSFLHMLVKFEEEEKKKNNTELKQIDIDELSKQVGKLEGELHEEKWTPTEEEIQKLEETLLKKTNKVNQEPPYVSDDFQIGPEGAYEHIEPSQSPKDTSEMMLTKDEDIIKSIPSDDEISDWDVTLMDGLEENYDSETTKVKKLVYTK